MKKLFLLLFFHMCAVCTFAQADFLKAAGKMKPSQAFDNIHVEKLFSDAKASVFVIWIKEKVRKHKHASHSETVYVLKGKGKMEVGGKSYRVRKGDVIFIPEGTPHAVQVTSKMLQVVSVQAPEFKGKDRIFLEN